MLTIPGSKVDPETYNNIPRLGWLVWNEVGKISQTFDEGRDILKNNGFDLSLLPVTSPKKAFILALDDIRDTARCAPIRIFSRLVSEDLSGVRYQVTMEVVKGDQLEYSAQMLANFEKGTGKIFFRKIGKENLDVEKLKDTIKTWFEYYKSHVYQWTLGKFCVEDIKRMGGVAVRPKGGVWFVPNGETQRVEAMEKVFEMFGGGSVFYRHPVVDTAQWRGNVMKFAQDDMEQQIKELEQEFQSFIETYKGKEVSNKSLLSRLNSYQEVLEKAQIYERLLSFQADGIRTKLGDLETRVRSVMTGGVAEITPVERKKKPRKQKPAPVTRVKKDKGVPF